MWKGYLLGLGLAMASQAGARTEVMALPDLTVYPDPVALQIDRLSRRIIEQLPPAADLPALRPPDQSCARCGAETPADRQALSLRLS